MLEGGRGNQNPGSHGAVVGVGLLPGNREASLTGKIEVGSLDVFGQQ
jgi:hypothetical protein